MSEWFPDKEDFFKILKASNVFFAPRLYEGIGISFIEAMTMRQCVVAPNTPTMNEYIRDGETGLLYDPGNPVSLDFSNAKQIANNAREYCKKGYKRWIESEEELIDFIYPNTTFKRKFFESKSIKDLVFTIFNETWSIIASLSQKYENVEGIKLSTNFGHQNAILAGMLP